MTTKTTARRTLAAAALGLATLALATGCANTHSNTSAGDVPAVATSGPSAITPGPSTAGGIPVTTIDGAAMVVPGGRPAVLFFFSVGCGACVGGGKAMAETRAQASGKADFLLVDLDPAEPRQAIDYFRQTIGDPAMPVVTTGSLDLAQRWKITQLSTAIVIDKTGTITYRAVDPSTKDLLTAIDKVATR